VEERGAVRVSGEEGCLGFLCMCMCVLVIPALQS